MTDIAESKFKSASDLGLTEQEYCGLVKVPEGLQTGSLVHSKSKYAGEHAPPSFRGFNMGIWAHPIRAAHCGSVCCLGGWTEAFAGLPPGDLGTKSVTLKGRGDAGLRKLFFPEGVVPDGEWNNIKPEQAARALSNYLKTGQPNWGEAMKEPKE